MATQALRSIQRLSQVTIRLDAGVRTLNPILRCASTLSKARIVTGPNNEKIIMPSAGEASYPETLIHEFVWNNSKNYPNHIALECGISGKKYTFAQAKDATSYIGRSLRNMGLKKGDVVALVTQNLPDTVLGFLGSVSGGLVVTTVNPLYTSEEMRRQFLKVSAKAVITSTAIASAVLATTRSCLPRETPFIVIDDKSGSMPEGSIPFDDLITRGKSLSPVNPNINCDDLAVLPFSSGTTGLPKGVMLTHRNLVSNIMMVHSSFGDTFRPTTSMLQLFIEQAITLLGHSFYLTKRFFSLIISRTLQQFITKIYHRLNTAL